jgi:Nucleotidyl transferase AbiEii toxin, Type IV TA system
MRLHEDPEAFSELVQSTAETMGLPAVYIEKDYWVTMALKNLSESAYIDDVVFKGGTSLSKAYQLVKRFSEDIDLAIFSGGRGDYARKRLIKSIEAVITRGLTEIRDDPRVSKGSTYRKTVYHYPRQMGNSEFGQASPVMLIEINAFTHPEPFESRHIQTIIAETLFTLGRIDLISQFRLESFLIQVLSVRRTLVEKILSLIKDSYRENPVARLSNRIRHLYDICLILRQENYRQFVQSEQFISLCEICIADEKAGSLDGLDCFEKPLRSAPLFYEFEKWCPTLEATYRGVFADLVFGEMPEMQEISETIRLIFKNI